MTSLAVPGPGDGGPTVHELADHRRFSRGVALSLGGNAVLAVIGLATSVIGARLLGPVGRGELAAIQSWSSFLASFAMLGLPEAVTYFSARDPERSGRQWTSASVMALAVAAPVVAVGWALMPILLGAQSEIVVAAARSYLVGLAIVFAVQWMPLAALRGRKDLLVWNLLQLLPTVGWLVLLIGCALTGRDQAADVVWAYLGVLAVSAALTAVVACGRTVGPFRPDSGLALPMLRFGAPLAMASLPQWIWNARVPQIVMASWMEPQALGLFMVAVAWGHMILPVSYAVGTAVFPEVASLHNRAEAHAVLARAVRMSMLIVAAVAVPLMVATPFAITRIYGEAFAGTVPAAMTMVLAGAVMSIKVVIDQALRGLGHPKPILHAELAGLGVTVVAVAVLAAGLAEVGASLATLLGYAAAVLCLFLAARRATGVPLTTLACPTMHDARMLWSLLRDMTSPVKR